MKTYKIRFLGREIGAIGIISHYTETVEAKNKELAILELYKKYEHVNEPVFLK